MKKMITFLSFVVVALFSGFPQEAKAQNKTCYVLKIKHDYSDSSYWTPDSIILKDYTAKLEKVLNNASGSNKGFVLEYKGMTKIVDTIRFEWNKRLGQSQQSVTLGGYLKYFNLIRLFYRFIWVIYGCLLSIILLISIIGRFVILPWDTQIILEMG